MEFMAVVVPGTFVVVLLGAPAVVLTIWGRRIAAANPTVASWRRAAWAPLGALLVAAIGMLFTVVRLVALFQSVSLAPVGDKAKLMSEGLNDAMVGTAVAMPIALGLFTACAVLFSRAPKPRR